MSRFFKFGKLHVTKGNGDKLLDILLTASKKLMAVTYEKTFEIEIINELSASVYNRVLNYVLNHELDTKALS